MRSRAERQVLWPAYFDIQLSRAHGRMVPKSLAIDSPKSEELMAATTKCGLDCEHEPGKAYPREWYRARGRVLVKRSCPKPALLRKVGAELRALRAAKKKAEA